MAELKETLLFVTSCFTTYLDNIDNSSIANTIESYRQADNGIKRSNIGGFQTHPYQSTNYDNFETMKLFENYIKPAAKKIAASWQLPCDMERIGYWYNINYRYSHNREHTHANSYLSGCYYIKVPPQSGNIVFLRSQSEYDRMNFITSSLTAQNKDVDNSRLNTEHWFVPQEGMLLLFPGHLSHYVQSNITPELDDRRMSLAFNFW